MTKRAKTGGAAKAVPLPLSDFAEARGRWRSEVQAGLGGSANPKNRSGVEIEALYTPEDWPGDAGGERYMEALGFPGQLPMTRGIYATMHRGRTWTQRQLIGLGVPEDYNARLKTILAHGGSAVSLIPCNSVYRGYDADEVPPEMLGTCGATVNSVEDMESLPRRHSHRRHLDLAQRSLAVHAAGPGAGRRQAPRHPLGAHLRHLEPVGLPLALRRQPHVLPAGPAGRAARAARPHRLRAPAPAAVEPAVGRRPAHAAGGRHAGRGDGADALLRHPVRQRLPGARLGPRPVPAALHVLLRHLDQLLRGGRQVPRGPAHLGAARRASGSAPRTRAPGASSSTARPRAWT